MRELVADRFVPNGRTWIDIATGARVALRFSPAGSRIDQIVWNDQRAERARLRHPLLNVLVDYGVATSSHVFEAYSVGEPHPVAGRKASALLQHAARFLGSRGLPVEPRASRVAMREVASVVTDASGRRSRQSDDLGRPIGVVIQPRDALEGICEVFEKGTGNPSVGPLGLEIVGGSGSGIRTTQLLSARSARLAGFVPVASTSLVRIPWLRDVLIGRHLCVFLEDHTPDDRLLLATFLAELGARSARRHVLLRFTRSEMPSRAARQIDSMGISAMTSMVFVDGDDGPTPQQMFDAARRAAGRPGVFLSNLRAYPYETSGRFSIVHESSPAYVVTRTEPSRNTWTVGRILKDAPERAVRLAARGRHAAAERLLVRATRVLEARGECALASACSTQRGWLARDRGWSERALAAFSHAKDLSSRQQDHVEPHAIAAAIGIGVVRTDQLRFADAESTLRGACAAADVLGDSELLDRARLALSRCLFWQGRHEEASLEIARAVPAAPRDGCNVEALALQARIRVAMGDLRSALAAASEAISRAPYLGCLRVESAAFRSMALVQRLVGDEAQTHQAATESLKAALAGHLPLLALRARCLLVPISTLLNTNDNRPVRAVRRLKAAAARQAVPEIVRREVEDASSRLGERRVSAVTNVADSALEELATFLDLVHAAPDERRALETMCEHAVERLHAASVQVVCGPPSFRIVARAGRAWPVDPSFVTRAVTAPVRAGALRETSFAVENSREPRQTAQAIRCKNEPVAVLCCRWTMGTVFDIDRAMGVLRAAALTAASPLRLLLERPEIPQPEAGFGDLLGTSDAALALRAAIARAARSPFPVLIEGESGSGKELVARGIHRLGGRRDRRLCTLNCAALSDELLEAELFGHARGAFTGAVGERSGLFEDADGGTIFLDEVGELSARAQAKLLRVLQDGEVRRVGENMPRRVDARVVAATNRRLGEEVAAGRFRADLRFRLDVVRIDVPPLRDRSSDIPALAAHFWNEAATRVGTSAALTPEILAMLTRYDWPGNVRELQNVIAALAVHSPRRGRVPATMLPVHIANMAATAATTFEAARDEFERRFVRAALAQAGGRRGRAAQTLGVSRQGLAKMMRRLQIDDRVAGA